MISIKLAMNQPSRFISGLWKGFRDNGIDCSVWYMKEKPAFDLFYEEKFDLLLIEEENLDGNRALLKCLFDKKNDVGVVLKLKDNDLCNLDLPLHIANRLYFISTNENLNKQKPEKDGIHLIRYAADPDFFPKGKTESKEDIVYIGKPGKHVNTALSKLCNPPGRNKIRLFSNCDEFFPFVQSCGRAKYEDEVKIYRESGWCLDIAEPKQNYISERCFEILACGGNLLTNNSLVSSISDNYGFIEDFSLYPSLKDKNGENLIDLTYKSRAKEILEIL